MREVARDDGRVEESLNSAVQSPDVGSVMQPASKLTEVEVEVRIAGRLSTPVYLDVQSLEAGSETQESKVVIVERVFARELGSEEAPS